MLGPYVVMLMIKETGGNLSCAVISFCWCLCIMVLGRLKLIVCFASTPSYNFQDLLRVPAPPYAAILLQSRSNFVRLNANEIGLCFFQGSVLCFRPRAQDFENVLMQNTQSILNGLMFKAGVLPLSDIMLRILNPSLYAMKNP